MPQRIVSELQALVAETRRKYPEARSAADSLLQRLHGEDVDRVLKSLQGERGTNHALVQPIVLACKTRAPKVVLIALALLQRSVVLHLLPDDSLPTLIDMLHQLLGSVGRTDVDVQLKILQAVSALLTAYPCITSNQLSSTLMLCFSLYENSRVTVVSSTAAATLRQNIMTVFDKVHDEDRVFDEIKDGGEDAAAAAPLPVHTAQTPDGPVTLFPYSADAYFVLSDLCALANGEAASFLPLATLSKPFVLELLESVLTNHARLFAASSTTRHPELLYILRSATCPLLLKALSEMSSFPVLVRVMRLILLLLRQFSEELVLEIEILLRMVLKTTQGERGTPVWHRVLALEVVRSLCADGYFMRRLWHWYDAGEAGPQNAPPAPLFADIVSALHVAMREVSSQLVLDTALAAARQQVPETPTTPSLDKSYSLYDAASAAVANVRNAAEGLLSSRPEPFTPTSAPPIQLLDQLDKTEAPQAGTPPLPHAYLALLVLWSHVLLAQSLALFVLRRYAEVYANATTAPPAMEAKDELESAVAMLQVYARPANDALSFFLTVQGPDYLFDQTLLAVVHLAEATGALGLEKERDRVLATLTDFALPGAALGGKTLGARNLACQIALSHTAIALAGSLGGRWRSVLQAVAQALALAPGSGQRSVPATGAAPALPTPPGAFSAEVLGYPLHYLAPEGLEGPALRAALSQVLQHAMWLSDEDFVQFVAVLASLGADHARDAQDGTALVILAELEQVGLSNTPRIAAQLPDGAWRASADALFAILEDTHLAAALRTRAASVLDGIAYSVLRAVPSSAHGRQRTILAAVDRQARADGRTAPVDVGIRKAAIDLLQRMLEKNAHRLQAGWDVIFGMCRASAESASAIKEGGTSPVPLIKAAFACVQLVCSDYLASLSNAELELCIAALPSFCVQSDDTNLALAANGVLWDITADVHRRQTQNSDESMSALWLFVLHRMRDTADVPRADVRNGAIANLFQVLVQYNSSLYAKDWERVFFEILFPLYDAMHKDPEWDESQTLVLQGTARILQTILPALSQDAAFPKIWAMFVERVEQTYAGASPKVAQTALDALLAVLRTPVTTPALRKAWRDAWEAWVRIGAAQRSNTSLTNLVSIVALLEPLYATLEANLSQDALQSLLRTLERCVTHGIAHSDATSTKQLYALVGGVRKALERLPSRDNVPALRLESLAAYVRCALEAAAQPSLLGPVARVRVQLAEDLLMHWQATYQAEPADIALYDAPVLTMLHVLRDPLQHDDQRAPSLASLAREILYSIAHQGTPVVARYSSKQAPVYYERLFACFEDVLQASVPAGARPARDAYEAQAFSLLVALERDVLPAAGADPAAHTALGRFLPQAVCATHLYERGARSAPEHGSLLPITASSKERFVYWTYDLLFALCRADGAAPVGRRLLSVLVLPALLSRCSDVLRAYVADGAVRGGIPMPRVRMEEVNYVLHQLSTLELAPGTLDVAQRTRDPGTAYAALQTYTAPPKPWSLHDAVRHAQIAHLYFLHTELDAAAAMHVSPSALPQQATIGSSMAPLNPSLFSHGTKELVARATRTPPGRTTPMALAQKTQQQRSAWLAQACTDHVE